MQRLSRIAVAPAAVGAAAVALILLAMPVGLVEMVVASSGLSEAWPAAAPPLGMKARLLLAGFGALMALGFAWSGEQSGELAPVHGQKDGRCNGVPGVKKMGFALSKLNWLARGRAAGSSRGSRPAPRRADAHPDAPARSPIFASRDFSGLDIFPKVAPVRGDLPVEAKPEQPIILPLPRTAAAVEAAEMAPSPIGDLPASDMVYADYEEIEETAEIPAPVLEPIMPAASARRGALTISELTARLERGLAQRARIWRDSGSAAAVLADMPVEQPIPVRSHVEEDVDQALRSALDTLRAMAGRAR
ncbi:MAG TPA: hypothetical protein VJM09_01945 [Sphingobium sp.]|nr:hypothetical protein [Sphingobium sp.]